MLLTEAEGGRSSERVVWATFTFYSTSGRIFRAQTFGMPAALHPTNIVEVLTLLGPVQRYLWPHIFTSMSYFELCWCWLFAGMSRASRICWSFRTQIPVQTTHFAGMHTCCPRVTSVSWYWLIQLLSNAPTGPGPAAKSGHRYAVRVRHCLDLKTCTDVARIFDWSCSVPLYWLLTHKAQDWS